jgi:hypothetical protein
VTVKEVLVIGQTDGLAVISESSVQSDVDGDGAADLKLETEFVKAGPGSISIQRTLLKCLNSKIGLRFNKTVQTIIQSQTSSITQTTVPGKEAIVKQVTLTEGCHTAPGATIISTSEIAVPVNFKAGELIDINDAFESNTYKISDGAFSSINVTAGVYPDTTFVFINSSNVACNQVIQTGDNYFAFKLSAAGHDRLGWIKVRKTSSVMITETVIAP